MNCALSEEGRKPKKNTRLDGACFQLKGVYGEREGEGEGEGGGGVGGWWRGR